MADGTAGLGKRTDVLGVRPVKTGAVCIIVIYLLSGAFLAVSMIEQRRTIARDGAVKKPVVLY